MNKTSVLDIDREDISLEIFQNVGYDFKKSHEIMTGAKYDYSKDTPVVIAIMNNRYYLIDGYKRMKSSTPIMLVRRDNDTGNFIEDNNPTYYVRAKLINCENIEEAEALCESYHTEAISLDNNILSASAKIMKVVSANPNSKILEQAKLCKTSGTTIKQARYIMNTDKDIFDTLKRNKSVVINNTSNGDTKITNSIGTIYSALKNELFSISTNIDEEKDSNNYLYVLTDGDFCKIGVASNIEQRVETIKKLNPRDITVLKLKKLDNAYTYEKSMHKKFANKLVYGEWFKLNKADIDFI